MGQGKRASASRSDDRIGAKVTVVSLAIMVAMIVALPTVVVLLVGLLPAFTWFIVDMTPGRYAFRCIAAFNVAGLVPSLHRLWLGENDAGAAVAIIADPASWLLIMCASGGGWMIFHTVPAVFSAVASFAAGRRIQALRAQQGELVEEWGQGLAGPNAGDRPAELAP